METQPHPPNKTCDFCEMINAPPKDPDSFGAYNYSVFHVEDLWPCPGQRSCPYRSLFFEAIAKLLPDVLTSKNDVVFQKGEIAPGKGLVMYKLVSGKRKASGFEGFVDEMIDIYNPTEAEVIPDLCQSVELKPDNSGPETWRFIRQELENCSQNHQKCRSLLTGWRPKRLLEICGDKIKLRSADLTAPYVALSYCWGGDQALKLTESTLSLFSEGIETAWLPSVFQNCVTICRELKLSHMWIDAFCIDQSDTKDWDEQSAVMHLVYGNAYLVVAAVSSPNVFIPFLGPNALNDRSRFRSVGLDGSALFGSRYKLRARRGIRRTYLGEHHVPGGFLDQRAWAWQEQYEATRCIRYNSREVVWECAQDRVHQSFPGLELEDHRWRHLRQEHLWKDQPLGEKDPHRQWLQVVRGYSGRALTRPSDRLPAIAGIAATFHKKLQGEYLAGLWSHSIAQHLAWRVVRSNTARLMPAPSWSWISYGGAVDHHSCLHQLRETSSGKNESHVEFVDATCERIGASQYGEVVEESRLVIRGKSVLMELQLIDEPWRLEGDLNYNDAQVNEKGTVHLDGRLLSSKTQRSRLIRSVFRGENSNKVMTAIMGTFPVTCVLLMRLDTDARLGELEISMILSHISTESDGTKIYQRIGLWEQRMSAGSRPPGWYVGSAESLTVV